MSSLVDYAVQGTLVVGIAFLLMKLLAPTPSTVVPPKKPKKGALRCLVVLVRDFFQRR
jgi:hypothetical protein